MCEFLIVIFAAELEREIFVFEKKSPLCENCRAKDEPYCGLMEWFKSSVGSYVEHLYVQSVSNKQQAKVVAGREPVTSFDRFRFVVSSGGTEIIMKASWI